MLPKLVGNLEQCIFPIKYGFMNVSQGQICFISNYGVDQMFPKEALPAIKTRLWEVDFDLDVEGNFL